MKRLIAIVMALVMAMPVNVYAQDRNWWTTQIDESDEYHDIDIYGRYPSDVLTNEIAMDVITFSPRVVGVQRLNNSVKALIDATTASRTIIVEYSVDGKNWIHKNYRNIGYKSPVVCIRKWQIKLHSKEDYYSSYCARQFKQGKQTIDFKKVFRPKTMSAQLYFDDRLIDKTIRPKVGFPILLNIPAKAKKFKIRYAYTGLKKELFSEWAEVTVR